MMRILMTSSAVFLAALGLSASFLPQELLAHASAPANTALTAGLQLAGAVWVGFAVVNWAARGTLIGGIYGRPIALGNFAHFAIGAIALMKVLPALHWCWEAIAGAAVYSAFAAWFGYALFSAGPFSSSNQT